MVIDVIVLAAGQGTRMQSQLPKVMHKLAGKPLLAHVLDTARQLNDVQITVVVGHGAAQVTNYFTGAALNWSEQSEQLGTGHAVAQALPYLRRDSQTLILYGDVPLISLATLETLLTNTAAGELGLLTVELPNPLGYGRIVRNKNGAVTAIVEQKDADARQLQIREINTGVMCLSSNDLRAWIPEIGCDNAQSEYYLTDIIALAKGRGRVIKTCSPDADHEVEGINTRAQLATLERVYQGLVANQLMNVGVGFADPQRFDCRGSLTSGTDVFIDVNCVFQGEVRLGNGVQIGPNCVITDASIGDDTVIKANSVIEGPVKIGNRVQIGPFARLREGTDLADDVRIGNFVETKKTRLGRSSKANHLSYLGDTEIGGGVNIGAGTITCNYDGVNKHRTTIGDGAFIGSNASLVAPISIGKNATVGAGSTVTREVPPENLAIARGKQRNIDGWKRPIKK